MRRLIALFAFLGVVGSVCVVQAAPNKLFNGNLDLTPGSVYYDGFDPSVADDVPGWELYLGASDGSYVLVSPEANPAAGSHDVDMGIGPAGGGMRTAPGSRATVYGGITYNASLTYDNYFAPAGAAYFIDWFESDGDPLGSTGAILLDPNGPFGYDPYRQRITIVGTAPGGAALAGVRFESGNAGYAGLAADHFSLVPEPISIALLALGVLGLFGRATQRRR
jgi:hypothetical protein